MISHVQPLFYLQVMTGRKFTLLIVRCCFSYYTYTYTYTQTHTLCRTLWFKASNFQVFSKLGNYPLLLCSRSSHSTPEVSPEAPRSHNTSSLLQPDVFFVSSSKFFFCSWKSPFGAGKWVCADVYISSFFYCGLVFIFLTSFIAFSYVFSSLFFFWVPPQFQQLPSSVAKATPFLSSLSA